MKALKVVLWVGGIICLLSVVGLALPFDMLEDLANRLSSNGAEFPAVPVFVYAVRAMAATYIPIGIFLIMLARNPRRYADLVILAGASSVFIGVVVLVAGAMVDMPLAWYLGDAAVLIAFGVAVLLLILQRRSWAITPEETYAPPPTVTEEEEHGGPVQM